MAKTNQQNGKEIIMNQKPEKTEKKQGEVKDTKFKPGQSGNPNGRPPGTRNFSTLFNEAVKKIATEKKLNITDPEREMVIKAVVEALKGNFSYYRDIMDRKYGRPAFPIEQVGDILVKLIHYDGDRNTIPIPTEKVPGSDTGKPGEVSGGGDAQEKRQDKNDTEQADKENA